MREVARRNHSGGTRGTGGRHVVARHHHRAVAHGGHQWCGTHHAAKRTVEPEFGDERKSFGGLRRQLFVGHQHRDRDREVETSTAFSFAARREIHRDAAVRPGEPAREKRCTHTVATLAAHLVGLADDGEAGQPHTHVHLDVDGATDDAEQRGGPNRCEHGTPGECSAARPSPVRIGRR